MTPRECLPVGELLAKICEIEEGVAGFYRRAWELTTDSRLGKLFEKLLADNSQSQQLAKQICEQLECGAVTLEASNEDLLFLTVLTEGAFYRHAGRPKGLAETDWPTGPVTASDLLLLLDKAIKLEKDLLLFYMKLYSLDCADHRHLYSQLIQHGQEHISTLQQYRADLPIRSGND